MDVPRGAGENKETRKTKKEKEERGGSSILVLNQKGHNFLNSVGGVDLAFAPRLS